MRTMRMCIEFMHLESMHLEFMHLEFMRIERMNPDRRHVAHARRTAPRHPPFGGVHPV
jgi:hypothetical protein